MTLIFTDNDGTTQRFENIRIIHAGEYVKVIERDNTVEVCTRTQQVTSSSIMILRSASEKKKLL